MPKGVYDRKKKDPPAPGEPVATKKRGARARKSSPNERQPGDAEFLLSDRGGMRILDGQQEIKLETRDVERLRTFLKANAK